MSKFKDLLEQSGMSRQDVSGFVQKVGQEISEEILSKIESSKIPTELQMIIMGEIVSRVAAATYLTMKETTGLPFEKFVAAILIHSNYADAIEKLEESGESDESKELSDIKRKGNA